MFQGINLLRHELDRLTGHPDRSYAERAARAALAVLAAYSHTPPPPARTCVVCLNHTLDTLIRDRYNAWHGN